MITPNPRLWSDFDGTAVGLVGKADPRNWSKYPLPGIEGYAEFLTGVRASGVEVAGVVSRRPDILLRRMATARSITKLGFGEFFTRPEQIVLAGSEEAKGMFVVEQSRDTTTGMLEDNPHKLGAVLLDAMTRPTDDTAPSHPIVLGVVSHGRSVEYAEKLYYQALGAASGMDELEVKTAGESDRFSVLNTRSMTRLLVVPLEPYSRQAGEAFGNIVTGMAA